MLLGGLEGRIGPGLDQKGNWTNLFPSAISLRRDTLIKSDVYYVYGFRVLITQISRAHAFNVCWWKVDAALACCSAWHSGKENRCHTTRCLGVQCNLATRFRFNLKGTTVHKTRIKTGLVDSNYCSLIVESANCTHYFGRQSSIERNEQDKQDGLHLQRERFSAAFRESFAEFHARMLSSPTDSWKRRCWDRSLWIRNGNGRSILVFTAFTTILTCTLRNWLWSL